MLSKLNHDSVFVGMPKLKNKRVKKVKFHEHLVNVGGNLVNGDGHLLNFGTLEGGAVGGRKSRNFKKL